MKRQYLGSLWLLIFLFLIPVTVLAQSSMVGLEPGANVKIVKKDGNIFGGKIVKSTETEYQISTPQGLGVKKYLKEIKKITDTGKTGTGGGISYRPIYEYVTMNDQTFQGVYFGGQGMVFDIDLGTYGIQKGISIESLKSIEVIPPSSVATSEQEMMVTCPHCGKPIRVRIGK